MTDEPTDSAEYVGDYDKLVRDEIPAVVRDDGNEPVTRDVDGDEYQRYLAAKLVEEAREYATAVAEGDDADDGGDGEGSDGRHRDEARAELADVYAVLDAIVDASDDSMTEVRARAREKADDRGGFGDGVVLERIESGKRDGE